MVLVGDWVILRGKNLFSRHNLLERFKPIQYSLDIYSLTYAVSQHSTNISKTTCQKLANEKRSLNSINYHNSNIIYCDQEPKPKLQPYDWEKKNKQKQNRWQVFFAFDEPAVRVHFCLVCFIACASLRNQEYLFSLFYLFRCWAF